MKTQYNYVEDFTEEAMEASIDSIRDIADKVDDSNIRMKKIIEDRIIKDPRIIHVLNCSELDPLEPDTYLGKAIKPYVRIPETQDKVHNYICYTVDINHKGNLRNKTLKDIYVTFTVFCEEQTIDTEFGVSRHDLLGYLIKDDFNWSNMFGAQSAIVYDQESVTDTHFSVRTIKFEIKGLKDIVKTMEHVNEEGDVTQSVEIINDRVDL